MQTIKNFIRRHKSVYLALYVPVYLILFFVVERVVPTTGYWVSYLPMDDAIPFCEYFVVFYYSWYFLLFATGFALLFRDERNFRLYMYSIIIGFTACLLICLVFPNGQDLRPEFFARDNLFTRMIGLIYSADTNTNVLPSMHVVGALACCFAVFHSKALNKPWIRIGVVVLAVLINCSTVLIKQHSILDVFAGLAMSTLLYFIVYGVIGRRMKAVPASSPQELPDETTPE